MKTDGINICIFSLDCRSLFYTYTRKKKKREERWNIYNEINKNVQKKKRL